MVVTAKGNGAVKISPSLFRRLIFSGAAVSTTVVLGFALLASTSFFNGLDTAMKMQVSQVEKQIQKEGVAAVNLSLFAMTTDLFTRYQHLPESIRNQFTEKELVTGSFHRLDIRSDWSLAPKEGLMVHTIQGIEGRTYYIVNYLNKDAMANKDKFDKLTLAFIWMLCGVVLLIMGISLWWLHRALSVPVKKLSNWAASLDREKLTQPVPNFGYRELNLLANQVHDSLQNVDGAIRREARFLKYASHELRTPIAIVRSNSELLEYMLKDASEAQRLPVERLKRAGLTMTHLTETLLWLNRGDNSGQLKAEPVSLNNLIRTLVEEHQYLLQDKNISIRLQLNKVDAETLKTPCRIVLANLIRNAMQHTSEGVIQIALNHQGVEIFNQCERIDQQAPESYGLGLQLVEQICEHLGWIYRYEEVSGGRRVELMFKPAV